jgi:glycerophosphoryl diester phosphodiesterase
LNIAPLSYALWLSFVYRKKLQSVGTISPTTLQKTFAGFFAFLWFAIILASRFINILTNARSVIPQLIDKYFFGFWTIIFLIIVLILGNLIRITKNLDIPKFKNNLKAKKLSLILIVFMILPFLIYLSGSTTSLMPYNLPPKPGLFAHRGASHIAPENTIIAGEIALDYNIVGWEIDVTLSQDGIPVICHDNTLQRTTNVAEIFPDHKNEVVEYFTLDQLKQLNAGSWFIKRDPYGTIKAGIVTQAQIAKFSNATIPTLEEALNFTCQNNLLVYLDLKGVSDVCPYYSEYFERVLNVVINSSIPLNHVQIEQINVQRYAILENYTATDIMCGIDLGPFGSVSAFNNAPYPADFTFTADGYSNNALRSFYKSGILVHEWTIDNPMRFQQLWRLGVKWVMTDDVHILSAIQNPGIIISPQSFLLFWGITDAVVVCLFILLPEFVDQRRMK